MKVGDLVKFHTASCPGFKLITVLGFVYDKASLRMQWVRGLEIGTTDRRLYNPEHCEVISESR